MGLRPYARERRGRIHRRQWLPKHRCNSSLGSGTFAARLDGKPSGVLAGSALFGCPHSNCRLRPDLRPRIIVGPNPLTATSTFGGPGLHIASFRCDAEFGRYRNIAEIDPAAPSPNF